MSNASSIRCLITAGPTREFIDPVRFISNSSTGKMGFALAEAAPRSWVGTSISSQGLLPWKSPMVRFCIPWSLPRKCFTQVDALFDACDVLIMTAAVSDFPAGHSARSQREKGRCPR